MWPAIRQAYRWVHQAARLLDDEPARSGPEVRHRYQGLLGAMRRHRHKAGRLAPAIDHFLKVTGSYWPGLFHCYDLADLPRTNNDLERLFGSHRHHQRRATGRKTASPSLVLRGSVQIIAAAATRLQAYRGRDLTPHDADAWQALNRRLNQRRQRRTQRLRFRRDPDAYLRQLEIQVTQHALPA